MKEESKKDIELIAEKEDIEIAKLLSTLEAESKE